MFVEQPTTCRGGQEPRNRIKPSLRGAPAKTLSVKRRSITIFPGARQSTRAYTSRFPGTSGSLNRSFGFLRPKIHRNRGGKAESRNEKRNADYEGAKKEGR